jgi:hypothetical protein
MPLFADQTPAAQRQKRSNPRPSRRKRKRPDTRPKPESAKQTRPEAEAAERRKRPGTKQSRRAAKDYSPRRKPWGRKQNRTSPEGAKETRIAESAEAIEWVTADQKGNCRKNYGRSSGVSPSQCPAAIGPQETAVCQTPHPRLKSRRLNLSQIRFSKELLP